MLKGTIIKIILVVLLAFVLRVLFLDSTPPGLYVDEAAIGYNAYTISHTGRDEHGHILPLFLESYGTFTSGLVVYFVAVQDWSLRITPVILGTLSVLVMIILASKYLKSMRDGIRAGLILALAPSHVLWSRA
ncbi:MAG: phospholipid carrier-dependent glycosyltransferase, partial [Patescibacteria group bacterium]